MDEHITGYYVRVRRDGKAQSLDIACLTEPEIREFFSTQDKDRVVQWVAALAGWIQGAVHPLEGGPK